MRFNTKEFNKQLINNKSKFEKVNRLNLYNALMAKNEKVDEIRNRK